MWNKKVTEKMLILLVLVAVFSLSSLSVNAAFEHCPGDTVNGWWDISNTQTVNTTQNITCEYINISNGGRLYINSSLGNVAVNITVGNLTIQAGGEINGTGTGFRNETGEGKGGTTNGGGGGGHGGRGSDGQTAGGSGGQSYGNALEPITLGSGGGDNTNGGKGGGAVIINVSNITWVNGTIAMNGEPVKTAGGGGGAGGSLFLDTDQLYGTGTLQATGGTGRDSIFDGGSGGGGRIAVYYKITGGGFEFNRTTVRGGIAITSAVIDGESGTAAFIDKDDKELYIVGGFDFDVATYNFSTVTIEHALLRVNRSFELNATNFLNIGHRVTNMTCKASTYDFTIRTLRGLGIDNINTTDRGTFYSECGNITIHRLETRTNFTVNNLILYSNKTLVFNVSDDDLVLNATFLFGNINISNLTNLSIYSTSAINASARGNPNGTFEGAGTGGSGANPGGGGGYGGRGAAAVTGGAAGGHQYGDPFAPRHFGAPGGAGNSGGIAGKNGGGLVYLNISGTLWNNGTIAVDGQDSTGSIDEPGPGSGGSIWIDTTNYYGTGTLTVRGGRAQDETEDGGGGGGGRIAVYYNTTNSEVLFNRSIVHSQIEGAGAVFGDLGTAVFIDKDDKNLYIVSGFDFNLPTYNFSNVTIEHAFLRVNRSFEFNATGIVNTGGEASNMSCYNTSHDFTIRTLRVLGIDHFNVSDQGTAYSDCGNITIHRLETRTNYTVNNLIILSNKTLIFNVTSDDLILNRTQLIGNLNITNLTNLTIYSTSILNASARGNPNGTFEGKARDGGTNIAGGGGGYGGVGGTSEDNTVGGSPYGDPFVPNLFGSPGGAGNNGALGGTKGGGLLYLNISGTLWNNGTLAADGEDKKDTTGNGGGAGSGGSIWIDTTNYYGTGRILATGGRTPNAGDASGSGAGGRVAVYYNTINSEVSFNATDVQSPDSADLTAGAGHPGTAVFIDKDDKNLYIVGGFDFNLPTYNFSNVTIEHAFLRANRSFEFNATGIVNTGGRASNMSCYNTSHDFTIRTLRVLGMDHFNVSDQGTAYSDCGNITIHRLETRTNYTVNNLIILSNKTLIFNVTSDDLILNRTQLIGNLNITNLTNLTIYSTSILNASARGNKNGSVEGAGAVGASASPGGGGGYGGVGGIAPTGSARGGIAFGDPFVPRHFGSPGGSGSATTDRLGMAGGGLIYLNISGTLWNNGTIVVDGEDVDTLSTTDQGGAGSGGSIWIDTTNYYGVGSLLSRGGTGRDNTDDMGAGGGGRIAVYYNTTNSEVSFNTTSVRSRAIVAAALGDAGTAVFIDKDDINLYIVEGFDFTLATYNFSNVTIEHASLRANQTVEFNATGLVNTGGRVTNFTCYNTSHDWTIRSLRVLGLDNVNISDKGANFNECGNITIHRLETRTNFTVNNLYLVSNKTIIFNVTSDDLILNATRLFGNLNITNLTNMSIYSTSIINASGHGEKNGTGEGRGGSTGVDNEYGGGGGYGGRGGHGQINSAIQGRAGNPYGDPFNPRHFGSPGGAGGIGSGGVGGTNLGSAGGGIIYLNISGTLWNNGTIIADGQDNKDASADRGGAGSGGSIWIDTTNYYGTGFLSAKGGSTADGADEAGAGGGGRIAVYYNTTNSEVQFNTTRTNDGYGTGFNILSRPEPATAVFIDKDDRNLYVLGSLDFNLPTYNFSNVTIEHALLRVNNTFELNATTFVNKGDRITNMTCYNTSHGITIKALQAVGLDNFNISDYGRNYNECGNITIHRTETRTNYSIALSTIQSNGTLVFNVTDDDLTLTKTLFFGNMNFTVVNMTINGTSSLSANTRGYGNGTGQGAGGTVTASAKGAGGAGYGGAGAAGQASGGAAGSVYGSNLTPNELGSGGGGTRSLAIGGNGGGFIFINASNRLELNGSINASGGSGTVVSSLGGGGGSGGSIWIWTRILNGTGSLFVYGGRSGDGTEDGGGGGGGRIAVYFRNDETNGYTRNAAGGSGNNAAAGAAGSIEFLQTNDTVPPNVSFLRPISGDNMTWNTTVNISATVTDNDEVFTVYFNVTYPDNTTFILLNLSTNLTKVGNIYNFSFNATQLGQYNVTFFANDTSANINQTEKTIFYAINNATSSASIDIANATNITFRPDPIRQNDLVSFNATFNVTGNLNATNLNITLSVDNVVIAFTNVSIANGTTRQVELNWTAQNGTHAIRINADANNTYNTETAENNNNATATVTVFNVSVLNFTSPSQNAEIIRGKDTNSLPGEDTLKKVSNFTTIQAKVYNKYMTGQGVNSNCTYYFNNTIFLGWNQTNTTGECTFTYDHTVYATGVYNITVNYTNLNTTNYLADTNSSFIQNTSTIDLGKVEVDLDAENQRTGSVYNPGDVAVMNITVTKNSTAFDPNKFIVEVKDPGTECNTAGGILFNHSYPGDIVRISAGLFQSYSVLEADTDVHWCVVVNNSAAAPLGSASHSDKEVTNTNANRANLTVINSASQGDDAVFDDVNITFFSSRGNYKIFDRNFSAADTGENRVLTLNERYNVLFRHPARQEQLNITGLNITAGNKSLPFNLLINYSGALPVRFTNITDIIAFNSSGFSFTSANITLQKSNLTVEKIVHCTNWNFSAGNCIGTWEINQTSDYTNFGQNATHFWFQVTGFTAYAGGNGSNANLTIYDQADAQGGSVAAEAGALINFTANYTRTSDNIAISTASCNVSFSVAPAGPSPMTYDPTKGIYNFTRTFSSDGNFTWNVSCAGPSFDMLNASDTITVLDTTAPAVSALTPTSVATGVTTTFNATVTDDVGVSSCTLFVNGTNNDSMAISGSIASSLVVLTASVERVVELAANCTDAAGNRRTTPTNITVTVPSSTSPGVSVPPEGTGGEEGGGGGLGSGQSPHTTESENVSESVNETRFDEEQPVVEEQVPLQETGTGGIVGESSEQLIKPREELTQAYSSEIFLYTFLITLIFLNILVVCLFILVLFEIRDIKFHLREHVSDHHISNKARHYLHIPKEKIHRSLFSGIHSLGPKVRAALGYKKDKVSSLVLQEKDSKQRTLYEYVLSQRKKGVSDLSIARALFAVGWEYSEFASLISLFHAFSSHIHIQKQQQKTLGMIRKDLLEMGFDASIIDQHLPPSFVMAEEIMAHRKLGKDDLSIQRILLQSRFDPSLINMFFKHELELLSYIKNELNNGTHPSVIRSKLITQGWHKVVLDIYLPSPKEIDNIPYKHSMETSKSSQKKRKKKQKK